MLNYELLLIRAVSQVLSNNQNNNKQIKKDIFQILARTELDEDATNLLNFHFPILIKEIRESAEFEYLIRQICLAYYNYFPYSHLYIGNTIDNVPIDIVWNLFINKARRAYKSENEGNCLNCGAITINKCLCQQKFICKRCIGYLGL